MVGDPAFRAATFDQVRSAMSWFIEAYIGVADWRATVDRLTTFTAALEAAHAADAGPKGIAVSTSADKRLHLRDRKSTRLNSSHRT